MLSSFRYNQYGCHCFQKGTNNAEFTGKGPAVDDIDRSCLKMHQCQRCLGIDSGRVRVVSKLDVFYKVQIQMIFESNDFQMI